MRREAEKYLLDIQRAAGRLVTFTAGKTFEDYAADVLLRSAVERQMTILGEAISQLARVDADVANQIRDFRRIISFRNRLVHLYEDMDHALVWEVLSSDLGRLNEDVIRLLDDA